MRYLEEHKRNWQSNGTISTKSGTDQRLKLDPPSAPPLSSYSSLEPALLTSFDKLALLPAKKLAIKGEWNEAFASRLFTVRPRHRNQVKQPLWCVSPASTEWKLLQPLWCWGRSSPSIDGFHMLGFFFFFFSWTPLLRRPFVTPSDYISHYSCHTRCSIWSPDLQDGLLISLTCLNFFYLLTFFSHITPFLFSCSPLGRRLVLCWRGPFWAPIEITLIGHRSLSLLSTLRSPWGYRRKTCGRGKEKGEGVT